MKRGCRISGERAGLALGNIHAARVRARDSVDVENRCGVVGDIDGDRRDAAPEIVAAGRLGDRH